MHSGTIMMAEDLAPLCTATPGTKLPYGTDPLQYGELSLPPGRGPWPVVVNIHGGCWLAEFSIDHSRAQAVALAEAGFAVWNVEYRRVGNEGGGWPGTFLDVSNAVDHVRTLAKTLPLDLSRACLMGHSAGGHLALWAAARSRLPPASELYDADPLRVRGVVALAPATELRELHARGVFDGIAGRLVGGSPLEVPERYAAASPADLLPLGVPQRLIVGRHDDVWGWNTHAYYAAARKAREPDIRLDVIDSAGHFEVIAPGSDAWSRVVDAAKELCG